MNDYQLIDSGDGQKLERFGPHILLRPCAQAVWKPSVKENPAGVFTREKKWQLRKEMAKSWNVMHEGVLFELRLTDFGHLGIFPEHGDLWQWMRGKINPGMKVLNLFAYSGGVTLAAAQEGAEVCHVDAAKGMLDWARKNAEINHLEKAPIRWIVDDVIKFIKRELKRGNTYDGIIVDPPTFGRGNKGEVFKIERDIMILLELCSQLLSKEASFLIFSCHTPGFTPLCMQHLLGQTMPKGAIDVGELALHSPGAISIPSGSFAKWTP